MTVSHSSSEMLKMSRSRMTPALLTRTSSAPNVSTAVPTRRSAVCQLDTSPGAATAAPPAAEISRATCSAASPLKSLTTTLAPAAASASASARPRPWPAPVTRAVRPSRRNRSDEGAVTVLVSLAGWCGSGGLGGERAADAQQLGRRGSEGHLQLLRPPEVARQRVLDVDSDPAVHVLRGV